MKLPDINLDDRTFDQFLAEGKSIISKQFPDWSEDNFSDPATIFTELFSFLMEVSLYQMNFISDQNLVNFSKLLGVKVNNEDTLQDVLEKTYDHLNNKSRAMTLSEFEYHATNYFHPESRTYPVIRSKAELKRKCYKTLCEDFVEVTILPAEDSLISNDKLCEAVFMDVKKRSLITTRLKVSIPIYQGVFIFLEVSPKNNNYYNKDNIVNEVEEEILNFIDPFSGGYDGNGWEFGRALYASEVYSIINNISGVDYVKSLHMMVLDEEYNEDEEAAYIHQAKSNKSDQLDMENGASLFKKEKIIIVCHVLDKY